MLAREEVFGPVLAAMTFRTPDEAVALANNTPLRPRRLDLDGERQPRLRGRGADEGGRRLDQLDQPVRRRRRVRRLSRERLRPRRRARGPGRISGAARTCRASPRSAPAPPSTSAAPGPAPACAGIDRTAENVCRRQAGAARRRRHLCRARPAAGARSGRPASATARTSATPSRPASKATGWGGATAHNRAQVLYYVAENLSARRRRIRRAAARR